MTFLPADIFQTSPVFGGLLAGFSILLPSPPLPTAGDRRTSPRLSSFFRRRLGSFSLRRLRLADSSTGRWRGGANFNPKESHMSDHTISRPKGGLINLPMLLAAICVSLLAATSNPGGGDGGLVNLPGGGGCYEEVQQAVISNGMAFHRVDGIGVVSVPGPAYEIASPVQINWSLIWPQRSGQTLRSSWTDKWGIDHSVETYMIGTDEEFYVRRHHSLLKVMLKRYPQN